MTARPARSCSNANINRGGYASLQLSVALPGGISATGASVLRVASLADLREYGRPREPMPSPLRVPNSKPLTEQEKQQPEQR